MPGASLLPSLLPYNVASQHIGKLQYFLGKDRTNNVNQLLESVSTKQFLLNLIPIVKDEEERTGYENMGKMVNMMPKDNFPYFNTLIRFQYALLNK